MAKSTASEGTKAAAKPKSGGSKTATGSKTAGATKTAGASKTAPKSAKASSTAKAKPKTAATTTKSTKSGSAKAGTAKAASAKAQSAPSTKAAKKPAAKRGGKAKELGVDEVFERLRGLQDVMFRRFELEREIEDLPRALNTKGETLNRLKQSYVDKNERYDNVKANIEELRNQAINAEREREQYESQMDQIKTQREYEALDKEIRDASEREVEFRRELQRQQEYLDTLHETLKSDEEHIAQQEEEVAQERKRIDGEVSDRETALKDLVSDESGITPGLDTELLFKFERIIRIKEGLGIVPLRGGVCTGCQIIMPPFFANRVRAGEDLLFCPNCSRIVFYESDEVEEEAFDPDDMSFDDDDLMFDDDADDATALADAETSAD